MASNKHPEIVPEIVYVARGWPEEETADIIPVTVWDADSRRIRRIHASRDQMAVTLNSGLSKWLALWIQPNPWDRGEWKLLDVVANDMQEVA